MRTRLPVLLSFVLTFSTFATACQQASGAGVTQTNGSEAHRLVAGGATLLDVRTAEEFAEGHLPGAMNIPVDQVRIRIAEIPANHPIVVYCLSGGRSAAASETLRAAGRQNVYNLGPMSAWGS